MKISREEFEQHRRPRFGASNPERMRIAFWEWMIRGDDGTPSEQENSLDQEGPMEREGLFRAGYTPWRARNSFGILPNGEGGPIWTFDRMGQTRTELPDGRLVCVGGEHEDYYDPDFCIYNDVVVFGPDDKIEIYGYPKEVFPPTDFHTATLVADRIIIVGCLGYPADRLPGRTPVYAIDPSDYHVCAVETSGEMPGWIFKHEAGLVAPGMIRIWGGEFFQEEDGRCRDRRNIDEYALDVRSGVWSRLTSRNWPQFKIFQADRGLFVLEQRPEPDALLPRSIEHTVEPCDDWNRVRFAVEGVSVSVMVGVSDVEVIVEGELPAQDAYRIADEIRANVETAVGRQCVLEEV